MLESRKFPFIERSNTSGVSSNMPYLPLTLTHKNRSIEVMALLDTGASVNVLPYEIGLQLGAIWEQQKVPIQLAGNLAHFHARGLILSATIAEFSPVLLAFAWTESREAPVILGHMNFFAEFDVCFYRADLAFEVHPRRK
ncbi:retroviral-like aspartic protease [Anabaena cylindrica FACHB-243]|uniref:Peptidase A2 domain-containing protein n=1 Tax=Anabaena cylindrica (strain ATCC 27899 / PCC 7122) TaxID=272123 RepID=K9ZEE5_ANACC|nr:MULTISPECIES: hypothetical protein [Anabaena]AFZ57588.1 hypothetical protein Anacy_2114 [Anabaena cylindrica PCC 7122]MBD2418441.1 retroviral-like aspartic protease [Anabaena cylindrica FACHB-243]MBY5285722.1 retroviral-like aspartic protease [Anabaena sp. CCAP 1446/1C]MBY5310527.1 retroviral-like aspartic protease [Anabaena sp. CCAP 1446/1C]MCM2410215.1 retroviral-like aspartic protease [Anabaena sp. CCAP 1446/1C]